MVYLVVETAGIVEFETVDDVQNFIASYHGMRSKVLESKPTALELDEYKKGFKDVKEYQQFRMDGLKECGWNFKLIGEKDGYTVGDIIKSGEHPNDAMMNFLSAVCAINDRMNALVDFTLCVACGGTGCEKCKGTEIKSSYPKQNAMLA